jgi:hypothetical protein
MPKRVFDAVSQQVAYHGGRARPMWSRKSWTSAERPPPGPPATPLHPGCMRPATAGTGSLAGERGRTRQPVEARDRGTVALRIFRAREIHPACALRRRKRGRTRRRPEEAVRRRRNGSGGGAVEVTADTHGLGRAGHLHVGAPFAAEFPVRSLNASLFAAAALVFTLHGTSRGDSSNPGATRASDALASRTRLESRGAAEVEVVHRGADPGAAGGRPEEEQAREQREAEPRADAFRKHSRRLHP